MLGRVSEALHSVADVIAPPVTRLVDFQYHWKLIQNFYIGENASTKVHVENTKIPLHLHQMLQFLVEEEAECGNDLGPCIKELIDVNLGIASCLSSLAEVDRPPGLRAVVLTWYNSLLRRIKIAPIHEVALYRPIQKLLISCNDNHASPNEKEEVELLLTLCGLVRKQAELAKLFLSSNYDTCTSIVKSDIIETPKRNPLFDYDYIPNPLKHISLVTQPKPVEKNSSNESSCTSPNCDGASDSKNVFNFEENDKFILIDLLLAYLSSADNHIVLRACEGIMIVTSLPDDRIAHLIANSSSVCAYLVDKLIDKYKALPEDTDPCDIDQLNITWGFATQEFTDKCANSIGLRESTSFLSWLDYCDTLAKECHPFVAIQLSRAFRWHFFVSELELGIKNSYNAALITTVIGKCLKALDSTDLLNEISHWLVGDCTNVTVRPPSSLLQALIHNCLESDVEVCLETLRLFEVMLEKTSEHILHCLVLGFLEGRGYHIPIRSSYHPEDEERDRLNGQSLRQERERNRQTMKKVLDHNPDGSVIQIVEGNASKINAQVELTNIHHVINSFLLLLPRNLLSDPGGLGYEQYMQDAHRHCLRWLEATSGFNWPMAAIWHDPSSSSTHSCDSRPEADLHMPCSPYAQSKTESPVGVKKDEPPRMCPPSCKKLIGESPVHTDGVANAFHQQLVLNQKDRCCLHDMAEDDEMTFDEGPFLNTLFKLLINMPNQPYQINLQLTAIFSKLAMMPHPYLHEYLLNPVLPTGKNVNTLFKCLQRLSKLFMAQVPKIKRFNTIIEETRQRLLGNECADDSDCNDPLFESLIVVEEFCKELAAIYFVKYHHSTS